MEPPSTLSPAAIDQETLWQLSLRGNEMMEGGPYPERLGEPNCAYYMRTGLCRFGMACRFNHPPNRSLVVDTARMQGDYPERPGQPECQYYLKTGTCKFGATCKFHHPAEKAGIEGMVQLNNLGYPLRPNEQDCAYYLRTGQCKFGRTCKFNHPPLSNAIPLRGSLYTSVHSPTLSGQQSYHGGLTNWPMSRASYVPSPRWQSSSGYAQLIVPQGLVPVPVWNTFTGQGSTAENEQTTGNNSQYYASRETDTHSGAQGAQSSYQGQYAVQQESVFPERPDQPECQFYMKTGDCKFGAVCRFHHPKERFIPAPNCVLSPLGLPLRPGAPLCIFYSRYGICKFGPNCKFDHPMATPMGLLAYNLSSSASPEVRRLLASTTTPPALTSSENLLDTGPTSR